MKKLQCTWALLGSTAILLSVWGCDDEETPSAGQVGWSDITDVPSDIADGDQDTDTLAGLACSEGQVPKWDTTSGLWICGDDTDTDTIEPNTDSLAALRCEAGQIAEFDGTAWVCGDRAEPVIAWQACGPGDVREAPVGERSEGVPLVFATVGLNAGGAYDATSGVATVPTDGVYRLCASGFAGPQTYIYLRPWLNGRDYTSSFQPMSIYDETSGNQFRAEIHSHYACTLHELSAGDTIQWRWSGNNPLQNSSCSSGERL